MGRVPEDRDARLAFLEEWAKGQRRRLAAEEQRRRYAEQIPRVVAQARQRTRQVDSFRKVAVIPVVITKPSDPPADRAAVFADLMLRLREYKWADPIVSECDEPEYITPKAIDLARRHRPGAPWLLYMEDDVILGPDFGLLPGLLREADEIFPYTGLVSFFSLWIDQPGWSTHPMQRFGSTLCFAIRNTDYLAGFRAFIDRLAMSQSADKQSTTAGTRHEFPALQQTRPMPLLDTDLAVRFFLADEYDAFALWCPSLVQHADLASVLSSQAHAPERISWTYKQAYG
jgi:hypothetical protein